MVDLSTLAYNFTLGVFAFFSPCGFPMLPAYLAYYLPQQDEAAPRGTALRRGFASGLIAAAGAFLVLLSIGGLAVAIGTPFKQRVADLELIGGSIVLILGIMTLAGRGPSVKIALSPSKARNALGIFAFGGLYAGVAASCVAPILILVLFQAFAAPTAIEGLLHVGAYAAGLATLLLIATVAVATAQRTLIQKFRNVLPHVERVAGVILVLVGTYLILFWASVRYGFPLPTIPTPSL